MAQRVAALQTGYFLFNGARFFVAALFLLIMLRFNTKIPKQQIPFMAFTGFVLFTASAFQQAGLESTTAANAGFLTSLYVVFVPLIAVLFFRERISVVNWLAAGIAIFGAYLLSNTGEITRVSSGDLLEFVGAIIWALHVILIGVGARKIPVMPFTFWQLVFASLPNLILAFIYESTQIHGLATAGGAILYTGIFSIGLGYLFQAVGQRHAPASDAVLILCLEAVFAAIGGWFFLGESMTPWQILGCVLIFSAAVLVQFSNLRKGIFRNHAISL